MANFLTRLPLWLLRLIKSFIDAIFDRPGIPKPMRAVSNIIFMTVVGIISARVSALLIPALIAVINDPIGWLIYTPLAGMLKLLVIIIKSLKSF